MYNNKNTFFFVSVFKCFPYIQVLAESSSFRNRWRIQEKSRKNSIIFNLIFFQISDDFSILDRSHFYSFW